MKIEIQVSDIALGELAEKFSSSDATLKKYPIKVNCRGAKNNLEPVEAIITGEKSEYFRVGCPNYIILNCSINGCQERDSLRSYNRDPEGTTKKVKELPGYQGVCPYAY